MKRVFCTVFAALTVFAAAALERSTPEEQGVASKGILEWVNALDQELKGVHSFVLVRHGKLIAEGWWAPYAPERPHLLYSLSKSFTSTAVGLAVENGKLRLDDRVAGIFPDKLPAKPCENLTRMRVRDLLCMATGGYDAIGAMKATENDWVKTFFTLPVEREPSSFFCYNTGATYMLSAIVTKTTGKDTLDYLNERVFGPLGITGATWSTSPQGIRVGGYGLSLKTRDIAAFGQLYLQRGMWEGKRILPDWWVAQATSRQIINGTNPESDWNQGYCFQFWRCRHNAFRGDGAFGQYCLVMPDQDAVLAMTAGLGDMQKELNTVWDHLLPAMKPAALPPDAESAAELAKKTASLAFVPVAEACAPSPDAAAALGKTFTLKENGTGVKTLALNPSGDGLCLSVQDSEGAQRLEIGKGCWKQGKLRIVPGKYETLAFPPGELAAAASGAWVKPDTYLMRVIFNETPYMADFTFTFKNGAVAAKVNFNIAFGQRTFSYESQK